MLKRLLKFLRDLLSKEHGGFESPIALQPVDPRLIQQVNDDSATVHELTRRSKFFQMLLSRKWHTGKSTIGELFVNGNWRRECYILEDHDRLSKNKEKVYGETAIPKGNYIIDITYSRRFKRKLPILRDVPGFRGIRIHAGNTARDTEGCLLPGTTKRSNFVGSSKRAFNKLFKQLEKAKKDGKKITLRVM